MEKNPNNGKLIWKFPFLNLARLQVSDTHKLAVVSQLVRGVRGKFQDFQNPVCRKLDPDPRHLESEMEL